MDFFARIQNKMLHAVIGHTAAELVVARSDPDSPSMGLTNWKGRRVRKRDVGTSKNYLGEAEVRELSLIVTMFLDTAELRANRRQTTRLAEWDGVLDWFLTGNELPVLRGTGGVSEEEAKAIIDQRYAMFDANRRDAETVESAEMDDITELKRIASASARKRDEDG